VDLTATRRWRALWRLARITLRIAAGLVLVTWHLPRLAPAGRDRVVQRWCKGVLQTLGVRAHLHGGPPAPGLLVANHVSWLDVIALLASVPHARFVCKSEVASWPLIGRLVAGAGTIFIRRGDARALRATVDEIAATLAGGGVVALFPEGTTSDGCDLLPFRAGPFEAAVRAGAPVLPLALRYHGPAASPAPDPVYVGDTTFAASLWRVAAAPGLAVELRLLPGQARQGLERRDLAQAAWRSIRSALAAMNGAPGGPRGASHRAGC
jgi:1-acyl-sn-glycerol-3-phosphate acyltransferase